MKKGRYFIACRINLGVIYRSWKRAVLAYFGNPNIHFPYATGAIWAKQQYFLVVCIIKNSRMRGGKTFSVNIIW